MHSQVPGRNDDPTCFETSGLGVEFINFYQDPRSGSREIEGIYSLGQTFERAGNDKCLVCPCHTIFLIAAAPRPRSRRIEPWTLHYPGGVCAEVESSAPSSSVNSPAISPLPP